MKEQRKIQAVVSKVNFQQAEIDENIFWSNTSPIFRLQELQRLRERYKKFIGLSPHAHIEKVVSRILMVKRYV